jgi:hypothetical protein
MHQNAVSQTQQQTPIERSIHFNQAQAIVWQIKFIINQINSKKALTQAANEIESVSKSNSWEWFQADFLYSFHIC